MSNKKPNGTLKLFKILAIIFGSLFALLVIYALLIGKIE